jgi:hypothetical protein
MNTRKYFLTMMILGPLALMPFSARPPARPSINPAQTFDANVDAPAEVRALLRRACYNCHSNETKWPWYSHMPVVSSMIVHDVKNGRGVMNFSEWSTRATSRPDVAAAFMQASCAALQAGDMPKFPYPLLHPEARLSKTEKDRFCSWANQIPRVANSEQ